jgi:inner membrane protein
MNETPNPSSCPPPLPPWRPKFSRFGTMLKMITLLVLALLLLIPLTMIQSVLRERLGRRGEAVANITSTWGAAQEISGPILIVPYKSQAKVWRTQIVNGKAENVEVTETVVNRAFFLPEELRVSGDLAPSVLHRGIYEAVVYSGDLDLSGTFAQPNFEEWKVEPADVMWEDAVVALMITDLRGAKAALTLTLGGQDYPLAPGTRIEGFASGVHARLPGATFASASTAFNLKLGLNGSSSLRVAPVGRQTTVHLASTWPDPSFCGAFLPTNRQISSKGFDATWQVSYYGRAYPQQWSSQDSAKPFTAATVQASLFGVDLISVVDSYRYVERSIKYGVLFVVLLFTAFFLFEVLAGIRVHPFQYTLVGMALCLFYLALLSLSEIIDFGTAYLAGAAASTLLITLYSARVLRSLRRALAIAGELAAIYGFLFVILRLQDYSLLFGTAGLFLALTIVMFVTRNIDWYARDEVAASPHAGGSGDLAQP